MAVSLLGTIAHWWLYLDLFIHYQSDTNAQPWPEPLVHMVQMEGPCSNSFLSFHNPWTEAGEGGDIGPWIKVQVAYEFLSFSLFPSSFRIFLSLPHSVDYIKIFKQKHIASEKAMASYSSTLAWKIPWMEEPGRLQSMGLLRVRHDWATSLSPFTFMHWRRKWQPIPVFLTGESQGRGSLVGCRLWGHTESDTT